MELLSILLGGVLRFVPEVFKWLDAKNAREHEVKMFDKNIEMEKLKAANELTKAETEGRIAVTIEDLKALAAGVSAQSVMTGVKWVDAFNQLIRPLLAFQWLLLLWPAVIVCGVIVAIQQGDSTVTAIMSAFGKDEKALAQSIASFWLVDRALRYQNAQIK